MAYKIKTKKKVEFSKDSKRLERIYRVLDDEAYLKYGSRFSALSKKEQKMIAKKIMREEYPYGI